MTTQLLLVGLSNTIHIVATVIWIGWSALLPILVAPRAIEAHTESDSWLFTLTRRAPPFAYGALAALGATGMLQMGANPQYEGMFALTNLWSAFLFAKHLLILANIAIIIYLGQTISPNLRHAIRRAALGYPANPNTLAGRFRLLSWLNLIAGVGVLALTGFMTATH